MKRLVLFFVSLTLLTFVIFLIKNKQVNWQFYTKESIGSNNEFSLYNNLIFDENTIFFNSQDQKTYSIDKNSGQINWEFKAQFYSPYPPTIHDNQVFISNFDGTVSSLDKKTGYKVWQFNIDNQIQPDTPVVHSLTNEIVFFGSRDGILYALDSTNGQLIWSKEFKKLDVNKNFVPNTVHFGSIYADEKQIYIFNALEKSFYAINQLNGEVNWQIEDLNFTFDSPLFLDQSIILKQEEHLMNIDKNSGSYQKLDRAGQNDEQWEFFEIKNDNDYLLILDHHTLTKVNIDLQKVEWQIKSIGDLLYWQEKTNNKQVEIQDNKILAQKYLKLENGDHLVAINYEKGEIIWDILLSSSINCQYYLNDSAFLGMGNGDVYSIDTKLGKINWQTKSDGTTIKISLIKDKILTANLKSGKRIAFNYLSQTGEKIWQYVPDREYVSNEVYINNDSVYVIIDSLKKIIEKIDVTDISPNQKLIKKINFLYKEVKDRRTPFLEIQGKTPLHWKIKEQYLKISYLIKNFKNVFSFEKNEQITNNVLEISIENDENLYLNKFTDLDIETTFNQVNQTEKIVIKGFYYDHNTWKIRFIAPKKGDYEYQIKIKSPYFIKKINGNATLENGLAEEIVINKNQFTINNEKAFFPIGIQTVFFDRNYNGSFNEEMPNSSTIAPVEDEEDYSYVNLGYYLNTYKKEAGINIFRYGVENLTPSLWQSINANSFSLDVNGGKFGDSLLQTLNEKDLKVIMTIFGFHPPYKTKEEITKKENQKVLGIYLEYIIARFSPYVDLWELTNEAETSYKWYEFVINYLKNNDPYHHPISTNWETSSAKNLDFLSVHWYNSSQTDPGNLSSNINFLNKKYSNSEQPVLISEFGFKDYSHFKDSADSMRILTWLSAFQKIGVIFWSQGQNGIYKNPDNANIYLGPIEKGYLLSLNNFLTQDLSLPLELETMIIPSLESQVYFLKNEDVILAYLLKINKERRETEYMNIYFKNNAQFQWIDPRTNTVIEEKVFRKGRTDILIPYFEVDLAMKVVYLD